MENTELALKTLNYKPCTEKELINNLKEGYGLTEYAARLAVSVLMASGQVYVSLGRELHVRKIHKAYNIPKDNPECSCPGWERSMAQIETAQLHHGVSYTGDFFIYCPWCGTHLNR